MKFSFPKLLVAAVFAFVAVSCNKNDDDSGNGNVTEGPLYLQLLSASPTTLGFVFSNLSSTTFTGYRLAYSTSPHPDENSSYRDANVDNPYSNFMYDMDPDTTYYVRAIAFMGNTPVYGPELEVRTMGYSGPGGGIVVLDRGPEAEGYRYVEVYSQGLTYETTSPLGAYWGIPSQAIDGLSADSGSGPANTQAIVNAVSSANCAAKLCNDFVSNGFDDWFLPSSVELYDVNRALVEMGVILEGRAWASVAYGDIMTTNAALSMKINANGESSFEMFNINSTAAVYALRYFN